MLIAIEGIDGCGKGTQTRLLVERAAARGLEFATFSFPRYGTNAYAQTIARYLNGEFGDVNSVPPEFAALLYAGDRLAARDELTTACDAAHAVICDRYVPSNLAHQAAKLPASRRGEFIRWLCGIEYGIHRLPRPDRVVYLKLPVELAARLVQQKARRAYTPLSADIHESDTAYLRACQEVYDALSHTASAAADEADDEVSRWLTIDCLDSSGELLDPETISERIWTQLEASLAGFGKSAI
jgi:dTMP kinase